MAEPLPQELRVAGIRTLEAANRFLQERYIAEFNAKFAVATEQRGTAFRSCSRRDLKWVFSIQTERVVDKGNTVAIGARWWQIDKCRWRFSLAKQTVTIHQHLDGTVSIRYGPHVVGHYDADGRPVKAAANSKPERRGKDGSVEARGNQTPVPTVFHPPLEISPKTRDSHFSTAPTIPVPSPKHKQTARARAG